MDTSVSRPELLLVADAVAREKSIERDEVTPTLKLRRKVILEHFASEVEALYG